MKGGCASGVCRHSDPPHPLGTTAGTALPLLSCFVKQRCAGSREVSHSSTVLAIQRHKQGFFAKRFANSTASAFPFEVHGVRWGALDDFGASEERVLGWRRPHGHLPALPPPPAPREVVRSAGWGRGLRAPY